MANASATTRHAPRGPEGVVKTYSAARIMACGPCPADTGNSVQVLVDDGVTLKEIAECGGPVDEVMWILIRLLPEWKARLWACNVAQRNQPPDADPRSTQAIEVSRRYAHGEATEEELNAAAADARNASAAAATESAAAWEVAWYGALTAEATTGTDAWYAAWDVAKYAAGLAEYPRVARREGSWDAARDAQLASLVELHELEAP